MTTYSNLDHNFGIMYIIGWLLKVLKLLAYLNYQIRLIAARLRVDTNEFNLFFYR